MDPKEVPCFWTEDPNVLLKQPHVLEFFPTSGMSLDQKLNAISRLVLVMTLIGYLITKNFRILVGGALTLGAIVLLHEHRRRERGGGTTEGFSHVADVSANATVVAGPEEMPRSTFDVPRSTNPFSNVLMTDYLDHPDKKPAPPISDPAVNQDILTQAKKLVEDANPGQPNISAKLFQSLHEQLNFEQSMRPFHSNPATTIPNDQGAFAQFCYGDMVSAKEGNLFALGRNLDRHIL